MFPSALQKNASSVDADGFLAAKKLAAKVAVRMRIASGCKASFRYLRVPSRGIVQLQSFVHVRGKIYFNGLRRDIRVEETWSCPAICEVDSVFLKIAR